MTATWSQPPFEGLSEQGSDMVLSLVAPEGVTALLGAKEPTPQTCVVVTPAATNCLAPQSQGMALAPAVPTMVGLALPTTPDPQLEEATSLI